MKRRFVIFNLLLVVAIAAVAVSAQDAKATASTTQDFASSLDKTKHKVKEKNGIKTETYVSIKNDAVVKADPSEYSGLYIDGSNMNRLEISVTRDGRVEGSGLDGEMEMRPVAYTLRDARVEGAVLNGTKLYADGRVETFKALFANQTVVTGRNPQDVDSRQSSFGIGFTKAINDSTSRVFLTRK